jgi:hypothetical protein
VYASTQASDHIWKTLKSDAWPKVSCEGKTICILTQRDLKIHWMVRAPGFGYIPNTAWPCVQWMNESEKWNHLLHVGGITIPDFRYWAIETKMSMVLAQK